MSVVDAYTTRKRHLCRHCGLALETYAERRRHVESHSTPSVNQHSYSVAPPALVPPSDHAKRKKYACKCDATFGRWDDLQHHIRSVCRLCSSSSSRKNTTVYTCKKCGRNFVSRGTQTRNNRVYQRQRATIHEATKQGRHHTTPPTSYR